MTVRAPWFSDPQGEAHHLAEMRRFAESLSDDLGPVFGRDVVRLIDEFTRMRNARALTVKGLEWEVVHLKSRLHKGRGDSPEAALRDLCEGFRLGITEATENVEREQTKLAKMESLLADSDRLGQVVAVLGGGSRRPAPDDSEAANSQSVAE